MGYRQRLDERRAAQRRRVSFSGGRRRRPDEPYTGDILLPEGFVWVSPNKARHQSYHSQVAPNYPPHLYQDLINTCIQHCRQLGSNFQATLHQFLDKIRDYKDTDTLAQRTDPNDYLFLTLYLIDNIITEIQSLRSFPTSVITPIISNIRSSQSSLRQHLPQNYSSLWHEEAYTFRLIDNGTGYYYTP